MIDFTQLGTNFLDVRGKVFGDFRAPMMRKLYRIGKNIFAANHVRAVQIYILEFVKQFGIHKV